MIKSGTNGYYDHDGCSKQIAKIPSNNIPNVGDVIELHDGENECQEYLVREVKHTIRLKKEKDGIGFGEWTNVYVINA
jgi:hypothetical protein